MEAINIKVNSGVVKACIYDSSDVKGSKHVKTLIQDLYTNLPELDLKVIWIMKVIPVASKSYSDVLKDFVEKVDRTKYLIMTQAGILGDLVVAGEIEEGLIGISYEREELMNSDFTNILFNRVMSRSYGNPEFFIYVDPVSIEFVTDNMGTDKIISRVAKLT